ncbi:MAG: aspartate aminotransferase family protein [Alphaproteobacteria bacterium]|nr:MAG: aspartate aminotransferase family protein [Alphaproteobacteria bacterium]
MTFTMPEKGRDWDSLSQEMTDRASVDVKWRDGKTAVYVFNGGEDVRDVAKQAYGAFMSENGLGPAAFPSLKKMEEEVVSMGLNLLQAPSGAAGNLTSGGTDSITMAIKAARDYRRSLNKLNGHVKLDGQGNLVIPWSAHPAFDKAASLMDLEIRRIPCRDLYADPQAMAQAVDDNTVMMVGSAPCFPYGLIDPIAELGKVAAEKDVWLHVDACVGGYFAPFARMNGVDLPPFDFEVPEVLSMSADLHKYGYAAKGASTVFFRTEELREHMIFNVSDWPGGRMITPTLAGTRPGGAIAAAWAVMNYLGVEGYREKQGQVCDVRQYIQDGVQEMGFQIVGDPKLGLMAFFHPEFDSFALLAQMMKRGWITAVTTEPRSLHLMLSPFHAKVQDQYLADLKASMADIIAGDDSSVKEARYS